MFIPESWASHVVYMYSCTRIKFVFILYMYTLAKDARNTDPAPPGTTLPTTACHPHHMGSVYLQTEYAALLS